MAVRAQFLDGAGSGRVADVIPAGSVLVTPTTETARGVDAATIANQLALFERFTDGAGSSEQAVDGSTTPVEFSIRAEQGLTKWVAGFRLVIIGPNLDVSTVGQLRRYAATAGGLTNGVQIEALQAGQTAEISGTVQTMADYFQTSRDFTSLAGSISNNEDLLTLDWVFARPVVLAEGSTSRITIHIRDDLTASLNTANATQFAVARGWKEVL